MMQVTYGNNTVWQMLQKWVWTAEGPRYAAQVAWNAGVDLNRKVSDLSEEELTQLQNAKIAKESPGLAKLLASPEFQASSKPAQYSPETDKNLEAVSQNANGVNYLDKTTNQILTSQQAMDKYGQPAQDGVNATTEWTTGKQFSQQQKDLMSKMIDKWITVKDLDDKWVLSALKSVWLDRNGFTQYLTSSDATEPIHKKSQDVLNGSINIKDLWEKSRNEVLDYMSKNDMINWQTWNTKFLWESQTDKQSMVAMMKMLDDLKSLKDIKNINDYTGKYDSWSLGSVTWMNSDPVRSKVTNILNTNLNNYIKQMTGATVGKDEAPRLIATQPTMGQSDTDFNNNLDSSISLLQNKIAWMTEDYWFTNEDVLKSKLLWSQTQPNQTVSPITKTSPSWMTYDIGQHMNTSVVSDEDMDQIKSIK
jgi:hypothetical protein